MALDATETPSGNFDLTDWKLTLPVDVNGGKTGVADEIDDLAGYERVNFFYTGSDGAMTFVAPVDGATTSGSTYARSELREMDGSAAAAWTPAEGGEMVATLAVDAAPLRDGEGHSVIVGQIHGQDDELLRLYWNDGSVYFMNDHSLADNGEHIFHFTDAAGDQPDISLGEKFSYDLEVAGSTLTAKIYADGHVYTSVSHINSVWNTDELYFKAGAYLGANETNGAGYGEVSFYDLRTDHTSTDIAPHLATSGSTSSSGGTATSGTGTSTSGGTTTADFKPLDSGTTQLEELSLDGFTSFTADAATGDIAVQSKVENAGAFARGTFEGSAGTYAVKVDYFDENDGYAEFGVRVNGKTVHTWVGNQDLGSDTATSQTLTSENFRLDLKPGDVVDVYGITRDGDMARLDDIALTRLPDTTDTVRATSGQDHVYGTSGDDWLYGAGGGDTIHGGEGSDVLLGGKGPDAFVFDTAIGKDIDYINDFELGQDTIRLDHTIFPHLATGELSPSAFVIGTAAADSDDHIIYREGAGALYYDPDGSGSAAPIEFAVVTNHAPLTAADIFVT